MRYEVITARRWVQAGTGRAASVYGSKPVGEGWEIQEVGWTVRNPHTGEVGACRQPWATREEAEAFAAKFIPSRISIGA